MPVFVVIDAKTGELVGADKDTKAIFNLPAGDYKVCAAEEGKLFECVNVSLTKDTFVRLVIRGCEAIGALTQVVLDEFMTEVFANPYGIPHKPTLTELWRAIKQTWSRTIVTAHSDIKTKTAYLVVGVVS